MSCGTGIGLKGEESWVSVVVQGTRDGRRVQDPGWGREVEVEVTKESRSVVVGVGVINSLRGWVRGMKWDKECTIGDWKI